LPVAPAGAPAIELAGAVGAMAEDRAGAIAAGAAGAAAVDLPDRQDVE
jgi:hypothetical protein